MRARTSWPVLIACLGALPACSKPRAAAGGPSAPSGAATAAAPLVAASVSAAASTTPPVTPAEEPRGPLRFLAIGGGSAPESTEVSIEQDISLATATLPQPGLVLFAGGAGSLSVRELSRIAPRDPLLVAVGELFQPRAGRHSRYRAVGLRAHRATLDEVLERMERALAAPGEPLLVYVAAHGEQGSTPRDNAIALWGEQKLSVARLAELHDAAARPMRLVATSCYSGGFAELAFEGADERRGPSRKLRCGLFAGTWDRETSGCDPNPDRRAHESYGVHFLHALGRRAPDGRALPPSELDLDGDGVVGLLEAHTHARIVARSLDVPTTTSERWLRSVERGTAPADAAASPEDAAVITKLGAELGLRDETAVRDRLDGLGKRLRLLDDALARAEDEVAAREGELRARLLERWPVLDDPYHPDFAATLDGGREDIRRLLDDSQWARAREDALAHADEVDAELSTVELDEARAARLARAYETLHLATALRKRGGADARRYAELLACERAAP